MNRIKFICLISTGTAQCRILHYCVSLLLVCAANVSLLYACQIEDEKPPPGKEFPDSVIVNNGFESDAPTISPFGWTTSADPDNFDASRTVNGGYSGKYALEHRKGKAYKITTSQTLTGLRYGYYSLRARVRNSGVQNFCFIAMQAEGEIQRMTNLPVAEKWTQAVVRGAAGMKCCGERI